MPELPPPAERYAVLAEHARGGQARILVAFDENLGRQVALKELLPRGSSSDDSWRDATSRFLREAELTAQLVHPGVVPVFEIGRRPDGTPFYTMQLVRGRTLTEVLHERRSLPERLGLLGHFLSACQVVAYAHSRGVVHRDIKPQNMMVGEFGETVLLDWGLAKRRGEPESAPLALASQAAAESGSATREGTIIGTPGYMSPEQASGNLGEVDERSDIYGLGAVLFEILTGNRPDGASAITADEPGARALLAKAPPELAGIMRKALAPRKAERYQSAAELAQDVTAFMTGAKVGAYAYSSWELARRFAARHRVLLGAAGVILLVVLGALVLTSTSWRSELESRLASDKRGREALEEGAKLSLLQGDPLQARAKLRGALELGDSLTARALWRKLRVDPVRFTARFDAPSYSVDFSPDGRELAIGLQNASIYLTDVVTRSARILHADDQISVVAFSPEGDLVSGDVSGGIDLWELERGTPTRLGETGVQIRDIAFSPDGALLAAAENNGRVSLWDTRRRVARAVLHMPTGKAMAVAFSPKGPLLAVSCLRSLILWDIETLEPLRSFAQPVDGAVFSPDGALLAGGGLDGKVYLWDAENGELLRVLEGHQRRVTHLATSPDGRLLASASVDGTVRLWALPSGEAARVLPAGEGVVFDVAFASDSKLLAAAAENATWVWDLSVPRLPASALNPSKLIQAARYSPDGARIAGGGRDGALNVWDASSGELRASWSEHPASPIHSICFSPDGRFVASVGSDGVLLVQDAQNGIVLHRLSVGDSMVTAVACSPDNAHVASAGWDSTARIWNASSGELVRVFRTQPPSTTAINALLYTANGRELLAGCQNGRIEIWSTDPGGSGRVLEGHAQGVTSLALDPAGRMLASGSHDRTVRLWDMATGTGRILAELPSRTNGVAWAPAGGQLAVSTAAGEIYVLNQAGVQLTHFAAHGAEANTIEFAPTGETAISTGDDGVLRLWDAATWRPRWYTRAVLWTPALAVLTQAGWRAVASSRQLVSLDPPQNAWRREVEKARHAVGQPAGSLCLSTDSGLEQWDMSSNRRMLAENIAPPFDVTAVNGGCSVLKNGRVTLYRPGRPQLELASGAALQTGGEMLVVVGSEVMLFDAQGQRLGTFGSGRGVSAAVLLGERMAIGFRDGTIELRDRSESVPILFQDAPASAVTRFASGPNGTLAAGFANGSFGLWSSISGVRLEEGAVQGAVTHLVLENQVLVVASETGSITSIDLSLLTADYCWLLREVWSRVPVLWSDRGAVARVRDPAHRCAREEGAR
jgi:WD40 repeat protein/serine/threonine protein kinase